MGDSTGVSLVFSTSNKGPHFMADWLTPEQRSRNMAAIRAKDTKPEMLVRKLVFSLGYRYRIHARNLPGCPDLVFPRLRKIIDVRESLF